MKYHFITFGNEPWHKSVDQLCIEARELRVFDTVHGYKEWDLSEYQLDFSKRNPRGFGFWTWKSELCLKRLEQIDSGDVVLYADAGCIFNPAAKARLLEYAILAQEHGIVGFQMTHIERIWTKRELLRYFQCEHRQDILQSGQVEATAFIFCKNDHIERFMRSWNMIPKVNPVLVNDELTTAQFPEFREHRHDQSIFSLIMKLHGGKLLGWETWCWSDNPNQDVGNPIWEKRRKITNPIQFDASL